jgi:hypothetical protein
VQVPHDLVTVIRERLPDDHWETGKGGRARLIDQPGDLPAAVRGICDKTWIPGHEALAVRKREVGGICTGLFVVNTPPCGGVSFL